MRLVALLIFAASVTAQEVSLEDRAGNVLAANCLKCHGGEQTLGGFDLSSADGLAKGGTHGPAVVPGRPEGSRLLQFVSSGKMPMGGSRLPDADIHTLRDWISAGAVFPQAAATPKAAKVFWSLRTPVKADPPGKQANPIDAFIGAKLREKGLAQAPRASHRTLIRRLSFDLTGLPPSPDLYQLSYNQAVERLLTSPHYGERQARHWLDVVRYGETDGGEHNYERMHAWRYRDYVIRAFNQDKAYDRFIREQITGDLIDEFDPEMVAATGLLVAGPWDQVSAELNKDKVMSATARMDELDDMVTTTFHTFQAMTVNCARCHDHKFDPIPTRDYYRLTAVFRGVGFGNRKVATAEIEKQYDNASKPVRDELDQVRRALASIEDPVRNSLLRAKYAAFDRYREKEPLRLPLNPVWNRNRFAAVSAKHWRLVLTGHQAKLPTIENLQLLPAGAALEKWQGSAKPSDDAPAIIALPSPGGIVSEIVWSGHATVYRLEASDDGVSWRLICSSFDHVGRNELDLPTLTPDEFARALSPETQARWKDLLDRRSSLEKQLASIPSPPLVYAAKPRSVEKAYLLERGSVSKPGEELAPGALTAVAQLGGDLHVSADAPDRERRMRLADWIANPKNPLTARVIVNRVWQSHFGQGIVNTPSDFGLNGDRPSHPELLDWLAVSFMENGWSLKWLHRLILNSETYRQSARLDEKAQSIDAGNRLLWRMPLKRMDAETLRDSILFATGSLDLQHRGGPSFALQKKGDRGTFIYAALENDGPEVWKRAVYRFVVRGGERIMLDSFDCPDPAVATPQRSISNTPVQALTLLNNGFVLKQAGLLAARIVREAGASPAAQIDRAYDLLYGRSPSAKERELGESFLLKQSLSLYCRALLNSNEFVYVP